MKTLRQNNYWRNSIFAPNNLHREQGHDPGAGWCAFVYGK
jgi:hypothetical protein